MKHLVSIMAVFLLMGCQTTNTTPAVTEPTAQKIEEKKPTEKIPEVEAKNVFTTMKPILCADIESVHKGLSIAGEEPVLVWKDTTNEYMSSLWYNDEKKTVSLIEYAGPGVGCFTAVGIEAQFKKPSENIGQPVKMVIDRKVNVWYK